jgi:hypothetical protein
MSDLKPNEENDFIHFTMRQKDIWKYLKYTDKLEKIFEQENLIGAKSIYTKLIALLVPKEDEIDNYSSEMIYKYVDKVISRFINDKGYTFEVKKRVKNVAYNKDFYYIDIDTGKGEPKTIILTYTSAEMIRQAVSSAVYIFLDKEVKNEKKDKKEEVIRACYKNIVNYISKEKRLSGFISHYKATVISGYIAMEFGYTLSADLKPINIKDIPPTNEQIYNAVKYFTDPLNPANQKKEK